MRLHRDQAAGAVIIALALGIYGLTFWFPEVPVSVRQGMGPDRFPQLVCIVLIGLSLLLMMQTARAPEVKPDKIDRAVVLTAASSAGFMALMWLTGMPVAMGIALFGLGLLWGERRITALLLNAVLLPAAIWAIFVRGLRVPLPTGLLGQLLGV